MDFISQLWNICVLLASKNTIYKYFHTFCKMFRQICSSNILKSLCEEPECLNYISVVKVWGS